MLTGRDYVILVDNYRRAVEEDLPLEADSIKRALKALLMHVCDSESGDIIVEAIFGGQF